ncbi:ABC transporter permease, partial [Dactylosporangium sp. NPDC051485]|uniref:ABC transporter permease n=1 Tax=Dactylosporangium sp. NPDC051485 TaxID=3154846 RepID=UPI0034143A62
VVAGTALTVAGVRRTGGPLAGMTLVMLGGIGNFAALLLLAPRLVGPAVRALGWLPGRLFGVPAKLATANAARNPARTAATTATLLIGVALMAGGGTVAATVSRTAEARLHAAFPVDFLLTPAVAGRSVPAEVAGELRAAGFPVVVPVRQGRAGDVLVGTLDPAALAGDLPAPRPGAAVVAAGSAVARSGRIDLVAGPRRLSLTVAATAQGSSLAGDVLVTAADFDALFPQERDDAMVLVSGGSRDRLDAALAGRPLVQVADLAQVRDDRNAAIGQFVAVIAALLGFALVIAVIGIGNTLSLSVLERAPESALVRALGLTRAQLGATLLTEALLMALAGALGGVAFGVPYGWLTTTAALGGTVLIDVPVARLALFVGLAALAAVVAAVLPARRAARTANLVVPPA